MSSHKVPNRQLSVTLPESLARFVEEMTGEHGLYETLNEFVCDLIRRHMEQTANDECHAINSLLRQSLAENNYKPITDDVGNEIRKSIE